jgi:hypothetical protein
VNATGARRLGATLTVLVLCLADAALAATLDLSLTPQHLTLDDSATLQVLLRHAAAPPGQPPLVEAPEFAVEPLPPLGGRYTTSGYVWRYLVVPVRAGASHIAVSLTSEGRRLRQRLAVSVYDAKAPSSRATASSADDMTGRRRVVADVDRAAVFVHEQVVYRFRYYFESWLPGRESPQYALPRFDGFYARPQTTSDAPGARRERLGGRDYYVEEVLVALFPLSAGRWVIPPTRLVLPPVPGLARRELRTETLTVRARPLPEPRPGGFSGGVGAFRRVADVEPSARMGEPLRVRMEVSGRGNLETLTDVPMPAAGSADVYPPTVSDAVDVVDGRLGGVRTYEYVVIPRQQGSLAVVLPSFSVFDPASGRYRRLDDVRLHVSVAGERGAGRDQDEARPTPPWQRLLGRWPPVLLPAGGGLLVLWWFLRRRAVAASGPSAGARGRRRADVLPAGRALRLIDGVPSTDARSACREVGRIVRALCAEHLGIPVPQATSSRVREALHRVGSSSAIRAADAIRDCEEGEFAPIRLSRAELTALLARARAAVQAVERDGLHKTAGGADDNAV